MRGDGASQGSLRSLLGHSVSNKSRCVTNALNSTESIPPFLAWLAKYGFFFRATLRAQPALQPT
eukprot:4706962-Amphidinium_carterae.1